MSSLSSSHLQHKQQWLWFNVMCHAVNSTKEEFPLQYKNLGLCIGKGDAIQITAHSFLLGAFHLHCKCLPLICVIITAFPLQCPFVFFLTL